MGRTLTDSEGAELVAAHVQQTAVTLYATGDRGMGYQHVPAHLAWEGSLI
jgi:hypothetical protein